MEQLDNKVFNPMGTVGIINGIKAIVVPHIACRHCANYHAGCLDNLCAGSERKDKTTIMYKAIV